MNVEKEYRLGNNLSLEKKEIKKYEYIARKIGAAKIVFSTLSQKWSKETKRNAREIIRDTAVKKVFYEKKDLLR